MTKRSPNHTRGYDDFTSARRPDAGTLDVWLAGCGLVPSRPRPLPGATTRVAVHVPARELSSGPFASLVVVRTRRTRRPILARRSGRGTNRRRHRATRGAQSCRAVSSRRRSPGTSTGARMRCVSSRGASANRVQRPRPRADPPRELPRGASPRPPSARVGHVAHFISFDRQRGAIERAAHSTVRFAEARSRRRRSRPAGPPSRRARLPSPTPGAHHPHPPTPPPPLIPPPPPPRPPPRRSPTRSAARRSSRNIRRSRSCTVRIGRRARRFSPSSPRSCAWGTTSATTRPRP